MKIVIDIHEKDYQSMKNGHIPFSVLDVIMKGTPLPKEHGDLIDRDSLVLDCDWSDYYDGFSAYSESQVRLAPIIIEGSESE